MKVLKQRAPRVLELESFVAVRRSKTRQRVAVDFRTSSRQQDFRRGNALKLRDGCVRFNLGCGKLARRHISISQPGALAVSYERSKIVVDLVVKKAGFENCSGRDDSHNVPFN